MCVCGCVNFGAGCVCARAHTHTAQRVRERDEGRDGGREGVCVCQRERDGDRVCEGDRHALTGAHRPDANQGGCTTVY